MNKIRMAVATIRLHDTPVVLVNHDRFVEILSRESQRMKEAISPFAKPLADKVMRSMAVVAPCNVVMGRLNPSVVVILHHVAIRTSLALG